MGDDATKNAFWYQTAERLGHLFSHLRTIIPDSPNPSLQDTKAEDIHAALKKYQGDEEEVLYFAGMDERTFDTVFVTWKQKMNTPK